MAISVEDEILPPFPTIPLSQGTRQRENPQQEQGSRKENSNNISIRYKLVVALCFVIGFTIYRIFYQAFDNSKYLVDTYFQATWNVNRWMRNTSGNVIIGAMQIIMDSWIIFAGVGWLVLSKNMRFPLAAGIIFLFRAIFLNVEKFPFDDYIVWHSPGFLSFTVPYDRTRDFFFSGHTASLSIVMMEMFYIGWNWVGGFAFLCLIFMMNFLIISRVHYTIDIIAGLIYAVTAFRLTILIVRYEDYLLSIPFYIGRYMWKKYIKKNADKQYEMINFKETQHAMIAPGMN